MIRQFLYRLMAGFRQFMAGRYGTDKLGLTMLCAALVMSLLGSFIPVEKDRVCTSVPPLFAVFITSFTRS